jgi:hypothetical protein
VVIAASVIAVGFLYFGQKPVTETVSDVLPAVEEGVPYAVMLAPGDQIGGDVPDSLVQEASPSTKPYFHLMEGILPLAGLSEETALLATWAEEANRAELFGVFLFPREEVPFFLRAGCLSPGVKSSPGFPLKKQAKEINIA